MEYVGILGTHLAVRVAMAMATNTLNLTTTHNFTTVDQMKETSL